MRHYVEWLWALLTRGCSWCGGGGRAYVLNCTVAAGVGDHGARRERDVTGALAGAVQRRKWRQRWRHGDHAAVHDRGRQRRRAGVVAAQDLGDVGSWCRPQDLGKDEATQEPRAPAQEHLCTSPHCIIAIYYVMSCANDVHMSIHRLLKESMIHRVTVT